MSGKRPITYPPDGERPAKRRQTSSSSSFSTQTAPTGKRPIMYSPDGSILNPTRGERPSKRRQTSTSSFATQTAYEEPPEDMDIDEEVTSPMKAPRPSPPIYEEDTGRRGTKRKATRPPLLREDQQALNRIEPNDVNPKADLPGEHVQKLVLHDRNYPDFPPIPAGIPEPAVSGYKMSYSTKMATTYKYLHVDSANRLTHETNSKLNVNFGGLPIENVKRVGVLKAVITNTGHNVYENHDEVKIAVRLSTGEHFVTLTLAHDYYTITEMLSALNTKLQAYTNANATLQTAVRDLEFVETTDEQVKIKVKDTPATTADTDISYALIADHRTDRPNTLLFELGFDKTHQTLDPNRYDDYLAGDLHSTSHYGQLILPSQNFSGRLFYQPNTGDSRPTSLTAFHRYTTENAKGFYLCSQGLTAGGNVLKTQVIGNGRASVQHDDHLVFIPNKALRDQYNYYETNVIEWVDVSGDLQTFDLEIRTHTDKPLTSTVGSAAPPFICTLIFECENPANQFGADSLLYEQEAYIKAHRQN